jgi:hypothetical protein
MNCDRKCGECADLCGIFCNDCKPNISAKPLRIKGLKGKAIKCTDEVSQDIERIISLSKAIEDTTVYHYIADEATARRVVESGKIRFMAKCMCEHCILLSLDTDNPHYGDGAYLTLHARLNYEDTDRNVKRAHGIDIAMRKFRAIVELDPVNKFIKILQTGGVIRSLPDPKTELVRWELYKCAETKVTRIEYFNDDNNKWEPIEKRLR